jgi:solute carrier family 13 (sodium-dependent dicarboxylate transporter), member 2/3/5
MRQAEAPSPRDMALSGTLSRFDRSRRTIGLFLGPAVFGIVLLLQFPGSTPEASRLAAVVAWVVIWWVTEAIPIPATALLGPALAVLLGVSSARELFASFGDPIIFLFMGGFMIAEAMSVHGLDRRIAYALLGSRFVGSSATAALSGFVVLASGLSMWISNTAATAMLYPIALGVVGALARLLTHRPRELAEQNSYRTGLLLACAYGASIGGIATPVGSPPNLIVMAQLRTLAGVGVNFLDWMLIGVPIAVVMLTIALFYLRRRFPPVTRKLAQASEFMAKEKAALGPLSRGEWNVVAAFSFAVVFWISPGILALLMEGGEGFSQRYQDLLPESVVAVLAASLLFILPVDWKSRRATLTWAEAARIDWGTLLLFGGGLALGGAMFRTGLAEDLGRSLIALTGANSVLTLTVVFCVFAIYLTEVTSNTATATMLGPLAIASAQAIGVSPVAPAFGCALGCSMAFMLPVATPPNAIVYGSGLVRMTEMIRAGFWMNLAAAVVLPLGTLLLCRLLGC